MKSRITLIFLFLPWFVHAQFNYYKSFGNLKEQTITPTRDGNYIIASYEDCYTPNSMVIEGCLFAINLIKIDVLGDTLWTSRVNYFSQFVSDLDIFENDDQSLTLILTVNESKECNNTLIGLSGWRQIQIINLTNEGRHTDSVTFPDQCQLSLRHAQRVKEDQFIVLAYYDEPISVQPNDTGKLMVMNRFGIIEKELGFPGEEFLHGRLMLTQSQSIMLFFVDSLGQAILREYDLELNLLNEWVNLSSIFECLNSSWTQSHVLETRNGNWVISCYDHFANPSTLTLYIFDSEFQQISEVTHAVLAPTNIVETEHGHLICASAQEKDSMYNVRVNYYSALGDSLTSIIIQGINQESPTQIRSTEVNESLIVGQANCCNLDTTVGPGQAFLHRHVHLILSSHNETRPTVLNIFPNPGSNEVMIDWTNSPMDKKDNFNIQINNVWGQSVIEQKSSESRTSVDISGLESGPYQVRIVNTQGFKMLGTFIKY